MQARDIQVSFLKHRIVFSLKIYQNPNKKNKKIYFPEKEQKAGVHHSEEEFLSYSLRRSFQ
jgi:hypothetical protein